MEESNKTSYLNGEVSKEEKTWGMIVHLSAFLQFFLHFFGLIIGPLVVWLIKKDHMPFIRDQGKEALNFNISMSLYSFIVGTGVFLMPFSFLGMRFDQMVSGHVSGVVMGIFSSIYMVFLVGLFFAMFLFWFINVIRAAISANKGVKFRYPLTIHFLSDDQDGNIK